MINKETYKRLTERTKHGIAVLDSEERFVLSCGGYATTKALKRLAELEDKIMDGTLVSIPFIWKRKNVEDAYVVVYESEHGDLFGKMFSGKNAKSEAEARLKELQEKQE